MMVMSPTTTTLSTNRSPTGDEGVATNEHPLDLGIPTTTTVNRAPNSDVKLVRFAIKQTPFAKVGGHGV